MWQRQTCFLRAQDFPKGVWNRHHRCGMYFLSSQPWEESEACLLAIFGFGFETEHKLLPLQCSGSCFFSSNTEIISKYIAEWLAYNFPSPDPVFRAHTIVRISAGPGVFTLSANQFQERRGRSSCSMQKEASHNVCVCKDSGVMDRVKSYNLRMWWSVSLFEIFDRIFLVRVVIELRCGFHWV